MFLLKLYIISTVMCLLISEITVLSFKARLKREGKWKKKKTNVFEVIHGTMPLFVPFINMFIALVFIFESEKMYIKILKEFENKVN